MSICIYLFFDIVFICFFEKLDLFKSFSCHLSLNVGFHKEKNIFWGGGGVVIPNLSGVVELQASQLICFFKNLEQFVMCLLISLFQ